MKKVIPLFIIAAGLVIAGYGGFKLIDTNMKTEQTLKEAKLAAEKPQELLGTKIAQIKQRTKHHLSLRPAKRAAFWKYRKSMQSFQSWRAPMLMI